MRQAGQQQNWQRRGNASTRVLLLALLFTLLVAIAYLVFKPKHKDEMLITILAVVPQYTLTKTPQQVCHTLTTTKLVKNKQANWWTSTFDSKKHPKYLRQTAQQMVCEDQEIESAVLNGYAVKYQVGQAIESIVLLNPPPLNSIMPLPQLQLYQPRQ